MLKKTLNVLYAFPLCIHFAYIPMTLVGVKRFMEF